MVIANTMPSRNVSCACTLLYTRSVLFLLLLPCACGMKVIKDLLNPTDKQLKIREHPGIIYCIGNAVRCGVGNAVLCCWEVVSGGMQRDLGA